VDIRYIGMLGLFWVIEPRGVLLKSADRESWGVCARSMRPHALDDAYTIHLKYELFDLDTQGDVLHCKGRRGTQLRCRPGTHHIDDISKKKPSTFVGIGSYAEAR
jgi:hypothetical protein